MHVGFIGKGMLDAACPGQIFTSPTPDQMMAAAKAVGTGKGVLFIVKNYTGKMLSIKNATVLTSADCAVINSTFTDGRRGVAGTVVVEKCVGSFAETGADLATCKALGNKINVQTASIGVVFTSCTAPVAGKPTFEIGETEIEMGVGINGEPGRKRETIREADATIKDMADAILTDLADKAKGAEVLLLVNGLGATPLMELHLIYNTAEKLLQEQDITIIRSLVGNYTTAIDMSGASITVCILDEEIKQHWDSPVHTAALRWSV